MIDYDCIVIKAQDEEALEQELDNYFHNDELGCREPDWDLHSIQYKFIPDKRQGYSGYFTALIVMQKQQNDNT